MYEARLDANVRARVGLRRGVATRRMIEEVGVASVIAGCAALDYAARALESIERKGKKSFRQTRIPEASSLQGSRINDLRAMIFRILGDTVRRSSDFPYPSALRYVHDATREIYRVGILL